MGFLDFFGKGKKSKRIVKKQKKQWKPSKKESSRETKKNIKPEIDREIWPIKAVAIIEVLGAPKDYVVETLNAYTEKLKKEKDLMITHKSISEPEQKGKFFSVFAEIELFAKNISRIIDFCFDYMPSSIEILEPEEIRFGSHHLSNFLNDLQARLHNLDMLVKNLRAENKILNDNAHFILRNNILLSLKEKDKDLGTISKNIGIPEEKTKAFLDSLVKQGIILLKENKYSLNRERVEFSE